jgi:hypothetical protein
MIWNALIEILAMGHQPSNILPDSRQLEGLRPPLKVVG